MIFTDQILYSDMWLTNFFSSDASAFLKNCEMSAFNTSFLLLKVRRREEQF